jgi:hypothetical protein
MNKSMFWLGFGLVLVAAILLLLEVISFGWAAAISIFGIGLVAVSRSSKVN